MHPFDFDPSMIEMGGFSGQAPVFPLPQVVLFPYSLLPLHIFEPRYRAMVHSALEGENLIAMGLLRGPERDAFGLPALHDIVCVGRIIRHEPLHDGNIDLMLFGLRRARIAAFVRNEPFRVAKVELMPEEFNTVAGEEARRLKKELRPYLERVIQGVADRPEMFDELDVAILVDLLAGLATLDPGSKQRLLEEGDVRTRAEILIGRLRENPGLLPMPKVPWPKFPPEPSLN